MDPTSTDDYGLPASPLKKFLALSVTPEQEKLLLERLGYGRHLSTLPARQGYGLGGGIAWGLADAANKVTGALEERWATEGLRKLAQQRLDQRKAFFDIDQDPAQDPGVPEMLRRPGEENPTDRLRRRSKMAQLAAATGDPALQAASQEMMKESEMEREYAALSEQVRAKKAEETRLAKETGLHEREQSLRERTAQEWTTDYKPEVGGFIHSSKHTGEAWLIIPGRAPVQISKGGQPNGPVAAATGPGGTTPPYVKLNEAQTQAAVRGSAGATGLIDALEAGFPSTSKVGGTAEALRWKAAEHGYPQLTSPDQQARVGAWDAVFDPVARMRAGLRIPEEQMSRMRMELRPNPGESWDNHVKKVRRIIETFRAEASTLPPLKSEPVLEELDKAEAMLPTTRADYDSFNRKMVEKMRATRSGAGEPLRKRAGSGQDSFLRDNLVPPQAPAPAPQLGSHPSNLNLRVDGYYK